MREAITRPGGLKKVLGPIDLILMGIGAIVGTGIFVLTGTAPARRVRHWRFPSWWPPLRVASPPCAMRNSLPSCRWLAASTPTASDSGRDRGLDDRLGSDPGVWSCDFRRVGGLVRLFPIIAQWRWAASPGGAVRRARAIPRVTTLFNLPAFLIMMVLTVMLSFGVRESVRNQQHHGGGEDQRGCCYSVLSARAMCRRLTGIRSCRTARPAS